MPRVKPLESKKLRAKLDLKSIKYADSREIPLDSKAANHQPRAVHAFELGLSVHGSEHHIFVAGEPELGRTYFVKRLLEPKAVRMATPPDLLYVYNFEASDCPLCIELPAGSGRTFRNDLSKAVGKVKEEIPKSMDMETFHRERDMLMQQFSARRDSLYSEIETFAAKESFTIAFEDDGSMSLAPLVEGKILAPGEFERLDQDVQKNVKEKRDKLLSNISAMVRKIQAEEKGLKESELGLERKIIWGVLDEHLGPLKEQYKRHKALTGYLKGLEKDVLENVEQLLFGQASPIGGHPGQESEQEPDQSLLLDGFFGRYEVNLLVDNNDQKGAPVLVEENPTYFNLLGCIERESEMGSMHTDHSLIKPGSLHKANHGFLIIQLEDIMEHPIAWEGLLRALRTAQGKIEDPPEHDHTRIKSIEPEPIPLDVKVVLIGTDEMFESLYYHDIRFRKLFKIKAHMRDTVKRNAANIRGFLREVAAIVDEAELAPFDRTALAALVDFSSRLADDQLHLSLEYPQVRDLMVEAAAIASINRKDVITEDSVQKAIEARCFRANLYEEMFLEDYDREIIKAPTSGVAVGRVNGLSVSMIGNHEFGLPHQIACTVGVGEGGIIDLEREAELGGPIHTKAMMILKSYLLGLFAHDKPLILAGSLYFEQSYAHVEGDSASGAELVALLSALADAPIDLSYAFTGAVNQSGTVMAVGGVTAKIEGFFEVCRRRGLTGQQGVLIPADNVVNLMLRAEIIDAVDQGLFHIYPITHIDEALEILTGIPAGKRKTGQPYPAGTLYRRVDDRLAQLAKIAMQYRR